MTSLSPLALLGATIRDHRKRQGLTQKALAAKAGLNYAYISDIERGKRNLTAESLFRIATALRLKPSHLVRSVDNHPAFSFTND